MRIGRNEIIEELTQHMQKLGGEMSEWCVGTAKDDGGFQIQDSRFKIQGSRLKIQNDSELKMQDSKEEPPQDSREDPPGMPGLAHREAHTAYAAAEAVEYLVDAFGLRPDRDSRPGNIVYVYRSTTAAPFPEAAKGASRPVSR